MKQLFLVILHIVSVGLIFSQTKQYCQSNLECWRTSFCCKNGSCDTVDPCYSDVKKVYIACGVIGAAFLIGTFIYFILSIKECRVKVEEMRRNLMN